MVVIERLFSTTKIGDLQEHIMELVEQQRIPDCNILVFWDGDEKAKTKVGKKLWDILSAETYSQTFDILSRPQLTQWIQAEIKTRASEGISSDAVQSIIQNSGSDMWYIHSLLDQLIAYTQGRHIELADVALFVDERVDDNIFNLVDALISQQKKQVYRMIREQYHKGEDAQYILAMIIRQVKILLQLRDLYDRDDSLRSDDIARRLKLHPFVVKKSLPFIKKYNSATLLALYEDLATIDIQTKTGQADQSLLLDVFVARV